MDKMQPWNSTGQGYRGGQGFFSQRPFSRPPTQPPGQIQQDISQQVEWLGGLSKEEQMEAKRLEIQSSFNLKDFQVVRREFIAHQFDPAMTIRGTSITFNNSCISKLEDATYVHFLINPNLSQLVIRAVEEGTRDAIRWCIIKGDKRKSRQITCKAFTTKLFEMMNWDPSLRYKMQGMRIRYEGEYMYLFDLKATERFYPQHKDPATGKTARAEAILPDEWQDSFGMTVDEHTASTQIDLNSGFTDATAEQEGSDE